MIRFPTMAWPVVLPRLAFLVAPLRADPGAFVINLTWGF